MVAVAKHLGLSLITICSADWNEITDLQGLLLLKEKFLMLCKR
jgi:hypothetical protein